MLPVEGETVSLEMETCALGSPEAKDKEGAKRNEKNTLMDPHFQTHMKQGPTRQKIPLLYHKEAFIPNTVMNTMNAFSAGVRQAAAMSEKNKAIIKRHPIGNRHVSPSPFIIRLLYRNYRKKHDKQ